MSHAYSRNHVHIIFGTKDCRMCIHGEMQDRLWSNLRDTAREYGVEVIEIGGTEDHVHVLITMPPKISVSALLCAMKANASKWMNDEGHFFSWQAGYGSFSVSASNLEKVAKYIRRQAEHHRGVSYQDEFSALLNKHGIRFMPRKVLT